MRFTKIAAVLAALTLLLFSGCTEGSVSVLDNSGILIVQAGTKDIADETDIKDAYRSYADAALQEAVQIIASQEELSEAEAKKRLYAGYRIETYFEPDVADHTAKSFDSSEVADLPYGCAVTDNRGHLIACCSSMQKDDDGSYLNLATERQAPYSTLKPLCVYAPAIESGLINWSSLYPDEPYKQLKGTDGEPQDWPQNASGSYLHDEITVIEALRRSLNTVPVHLLHDYGVSKVIGLMQEQFNMPLDYEYEKVMTQGEDEVIGNVAMGYTYAGLSPIELAGYYSVFAAKGVYAAPTCIKRITDTGGAVIYEHNDTSKQVFSEETASIMNHMLQRVTEAGGTGTEAYIDGAFVAGKTGTGTSDNGHWFVGTVPQYSCAVWHGGHTQRNASPAVFKEIISNLTLDPNADYPWCGNVEERAYCEESGLLASSGCSKVNIGYYLADDKKEVCRDHQSY